MAFCGKCGTQINDGVRFCPGCGAAAEVAAAPQPVAAGAVQQPAAPSAQPVQQPVQPSYQQPVQPNAFQKLNDTADITGECDPQDIVNNKIMAVLSYFGPLFLIPWFAAPQSKFARFHAKQGMLLCIVAVAYSIISAILCAVIKVDYKLWGYSTGVKVTPGWLFTILWLISIPICILAIIGIVNAVQGKAKELPILGKLKIGK